tara:strand:- start:1997 stop:2641 length:645 start_codon:yes stop_codon:yes gene_type:complete
MERLPMEQYDESIKSDWDKLLSERDFTHYIETSLEIRDHEKKTREIDGKRIKGAQMCAMRQAFSTGKDKKGAVYFLMRAVHNWKQRYFYEIKFKPHPHIRDDETVSRKLHKGVMTQMELEIEELVEQLEGHNTMSIKDHKEEVEELNDKIYQLERENKKFKSDKEKDNESLENYYKKKSEGDCLMLQKKIDWLTVEINKMTKTQDKVLLATNGK